MRLCMHARVYRGARIDSALYCRLRKMTMIKTRPTTIATILARTHTHTQYSLLSSFNTHNLNLYARFFFISSASPFPTCSFVWKINNSCYANWIYGTIIEVNRATPLRHMIKYANGIYEKRKQSNLVVFVLEIRLIIRCAYLAANMAFEGFRKFLFRLNRSILLYTHNKKHLEGRIRDEFIHQ